MFRVATPLLRVPVPIAAVPSINVTVPVAAAGESVAVSVMELPWIEGLADDVNTVGDGNVPIVCTGTASANAAIVSFFGLPPGLAANTPPMRFERPFR